MQLKEPVTKSYMYFFFSISSQGQLMIRFTVNADIYAKDEAAVKWILPIRGSTWYAGKRQQPAKLWRQKHRKVTQSPQNIYTKAPNYFSPKVPKLLIFKNFSKGRFV